MSSTQALKRITTDIAPRTDFGWRSEWASLFGFMVLLPTGFFLALGSAAAHAALNGGGLPPVGPVGMAIGVIAAALFIVGMANVKFQDRRYEHVIYPANRALAMAKIEELRPVLRSEGVDMPDGFVESYVDAVTRGVAPIEYAGGRDPRRTTFTSNGHTVTITLPRRETTFLIEITPAT